MGMLGVGLGWCRVWKLVMLECVEFVACDGLVL